MQEYEWGGNVGLGWFLTASRFKLLSEPLKVRSLMIVLLLHFLCTNHCCVVIQVGLRLAVDRKRTSSGPLGGSGISYASVTTEEVDDEYSTATF